MKLPLLTLVAAACTLVATARAQKPDSPQKGALGQSTPGKTSQQSATSGSTGAALASPSAPGMAFVGPNDACASATVISGPGPHAFDTVGATTDGPGACGIFTNDVWFDWTAGTTATYAVSLCTGATTYDSEVAVYSTSACLGGLIICNDDCCDLVSYATFPATMGSVYKIRIGGYEGDSGTGTFTITPIPVVAASPDSCNFAAAIAGPGPHPFNNTAATTGAEGQGNANCDFFGTTGIENDVWFRWTAGTTGSATLSLCSGVFCTDTKVAIYSGVGCPAAQAISCNDDSCDLVSEVHFCVTSGQQYTIQLGNFPGTVGGTGSFDISVVAGGAGNDECAGATVLPPTGPYAFDNSSATTSCVGQSNSNCNFFGTPQIENDLWYTWTANATGVASVTTCGTVAFDSKIAVYSGAGCPSGQAIACKDDSCLLQTTVCFNATSGQTYTIQLGSYPGAGGGAGTFDITVAPPLPLCQKDDGSSEDVFGFAAGGEMVWIQRFGAASGSTSVSNIQVAWGSPAVPGASPGNGTAAKVGIWDDPDDDGDPSDLVLVQVVNTTVQNVDTDTFNTIPITPVSMNGEFYVGAGLVHAGGQFVAPMDFSCSQTDVAWVFGDDTGGAANYTTPSTNPIPPETFDLNGFECNLMVRAGCSVSPMTRFCLPGQDGIIACPCGNPPAGGGLGCNNFGGGPAASGTLGASGTADDSADTTATPAVFLESTGENNTSLTVFWSGKPPAHSPGLVHGAGVRCVTVQLKRLYTGNAAGGAVTRPRLPAGTDPSVSDRHMQTFATLVPPETRYYFNIYRDPAAAGPCGNTASTINLTNAGSIAWVP